MRLALINLTRDEFSPPLGLASLATYIREYGGFEKTRIIDANYDDVFRETINYRPDIVGISAMSHYYKEAIDTAQRIKERIDVTVFIGGIHISSLPNSFSPYFELGVMGEGEVTLLELMELYEQESVLPKESLKKINGIIYLENGKLIESGMREQIKPLDKIPIIDRDFLNKGYFRKRWIAGEMKKAVGATILTSRGCPYRCVFCNTSRFWQKLRFNSPERVCEEVRYLNEKYGVQHIQIWDDLFTQNRKRLKEISRLFKAEGISGKVTFHCHPRANLMDDEICKLMKDLGVSTINFGFESGSENMLHYLKGGSVTVEDNRRAVILGKKYGFSVVGSLIFGSPGETINDMKKTLEFIDFFDKNGGDNLWHFVMTPFPGTPIWEIAKERGKVTDEMNWHLLRHQNIDKPLLLDSEIEFEEFEEILDKADDRIYKLRATRGGWIIKKVLKDPVRLLKRVKQEPAKAAKTLLYLIKRQRNAG